MPFELFPTDYELPHVNLTIKLRLGDETNRKAPRLKGFVAIDRQTAQAILQHIDANGGGVIFLDTALWERPTTDPKDWNYTGAVQISNYTPPQEKPKEARDSERSPWY